jgi:hypothetical protein
VRAKGKTHFVVGIADALLLALRVLLRSVLEVLCLGQDGPCLDNVVVCSRDGLCIRWLVEFSDRLRRVVRTLIWTAKRTTGLLQLAGFHRVGKYRTVPRGNAYRPGRCDATCRLRRFLAGQSLQLGRSRLPSALRVEKDVLMR